MKKRNKIITIVFAILLILIAAWGIKSYKEASGTVPFSETIEQDGLRIIKATGKPFSGRVKYESKNLDSIGIYKDGKITQSIVYDKTRTPWTDEFKHVLSTRKSIYIVPLSIGIILLLINLLFTTVYYIKNQSKKPNKFVKTGLMFSIILMFSLFAYAFFSVSKEISRETARRFSCDGNLTQIGLALWMYSNIYDGQFPHLDGAEGLDLLRKTEILDHPIYFRCPSCNTESAPPGEPLTEEHFDYIYRGGYGINDNPKIGILYDRKGNHYKFGNILFIDGHDKGFYGEDWQKNIEPKAKNDFVTNDSVK